MKKYNQFEKVFAFLVFIWIVIYIMSKFGETMGIAFSFIKKILN